MAYQISTILVGVSPLLQHKFGIDVLNNLMTGAEKRVGKEDYRNEWVKTMYVNREGYLIQPATHIEGSMFKAAGSFLIKGRKGKSYKEAVQGHVFISPAEILHLRNGAPVVAPDENLLENPTDFLEVSIMRAKIQRAAITRLRLQIAAGWELQFVLDVDDDTIQPEVLRSVLEEAGRAVGIGDYRPRYGRYRIECFDLM